MIPIHELLNRIRWDPAFAQGEFVLGYYDRVEDRIIRLPLDRVHLDPADHFAFQATGEDGYSHPIPFHRVREVFKNGELIWHRDG